MIKAIIADVDGVMVGNKHGINFPYPNHEVTQKLKELREHGIPIILCTAKYHTGIGELIKRADLRNPHITSGGALIIDPLDNNIVNKHSIDNALVKQIVTTSVDNNIYTECYGTDGYYVQKDQVFELTEKHTLVQQLEPKIVSSLKDDLITTDIIKIEVFAKNKEDIPRVESLIKKFADNINIVWTMHPTILPFQICVITLKGVSKKVASLEVLEYLNISPDETLGIGDTLGDWNFMEICKYGATVGDESKELKDLVKAKGEGNYFYGSSVDEDGLLDVFNYFKI